MLLSSLVNSGDLVHVHTALASETYPDHRSFPFCPINFPQKKKSKKNSLVMIFYFIRTSRNVVIYTLPVSFSVLWVINLSFLLFSQSERWRKKLYNMIFFQHFWWQVREFAFFFSFHLHFSLENDREIESYTIWKLLSELPPYLKFTSVL